MQPDRDVTGVEIDWRGRTPLAGVTRWRCLERVHGVTAERTQFWPVIAFVHAGAYEVHGPRGRSLVDPLHVAFFRPGEPYQTAHPCGLGDEGSALVLREDLFADLVAARLPEAADDPRRLDAAGSRPLFFSLFGRTSNEDSCDQEDGARPRAGAFVRRPRHGAGRGHEGQGIPPRRVDLGERLRRAP